MSKISHWFTHYLYEKTRKDVTDLYFQYNFWSKVSFSPTGNSFKWLECQEMQLYVAVQAL